MGSFAGPHHAKLKDFISWFEIPVFDIHRATAFYNAIYNMEMEASYNDDFAMAYFPANKGIGGALIQGPGCYPSETGVLIYLNAGNDLDSILGRVDLAGGRVIMGRTLISENSGCFALFIDSEGNRIALHESTAKPAKSGDSTKARVRKAAKSAPRKKAAR
ncbi:MAG: VOC family protein [Flavobacteriales bacterium]|nr:VOC family protein [Flavobacteriales bacterium]